MIKIYDRKDNSYSIEKVAGDKCIKWCYDSPIGKSFTELIIKRKLFSKFYGKYCDTTTSKKKIPTFINNFGIDMSIVYKEESEFTSFNDFFIRKLNENSRPFDKDTSKLISPGDGRLFAYQNIDMDNLVQVKGLTYSLRELINNDKLAQKYDNGTCIVLRLCPTDYHRFHFIDNGIPSKSELIHGSYYSVNPTALERIPKLYCQNKREWSLFKSENFGDIIHIEVGATCVGTIFQTYTPNSHVLKGSEKGYFKFGGSTTILFFKENTVEIDKDIIEQTNKGYECKVQFGETIGTKVLREDS